MAIDLLRSDEFDKPSSERLNVRIVDSRVCPLEDAIDWPTELLTPSEISMVNDVHGFISGYSQVPRRVMPVIGAQLQQDLERFSDPIFTSVDKSPSIESYIACIDELINKLSDDLGEEIFALYEGGEWDEIVPTIINHFSQDANVNALKDNKGRMLEIQGDLLAKATRQGLAIYLRLALRIHSINLYSQ